MISSLLTIGSPGWPGRLCLSSPAWSAGGGFRSGLTDLIFIEDSDQADFKWVFFNGDGSEAEMCGNGARCAARFAYMQGIAPAHMRFETIAGIIEANVSDCQCQRAYDGAKGFPAGQNSPARWTETVTLHSVDTGVPHAVIFVDDYAGFDICTTGRAIRFHQDFMPAGTNVNFVRLLENGALKVRTYERGVENETLACGTGAVASALIAAVLGKARSPVDIVTSGGDRLTIHF